MIFVFLVILVIGGGYFAWRALTSPYKGFAGPKKDVEVRKGLRSATILRHLQEEGIIRDQYVPLIYMKLVRRGDSMKAGVYEFTGPIS